MPKFLNATQARGEIESILNKANSNIFMISPFIKIHDELIARLEDAGNRRHIKIVIVCREKDLREEERRKVEQIQNLELRFNERVHAKCYYNEESMVIASLNLYDSSQGDNHEMGILLSNKAEEDREAFQDAVSEASYIIRAASYAVSKALGSSRSNDTRPAMVKSESAETPRVKGKESLETSIAKGIGRFLGLGDDKGYCIRCETRIAMDKDSPYCPKCYRVWAKYKRGDFEEAVCHSCGKSAKTSKNKPLCSTCYSKQ